MKTFLTLSLLVCQILFCGIELFAQAHSSVVSYRNEKRPAVSIKLKAPVDLTEVVLAEKLKNSGMTEKGVQRGIFKVYRNVLFEPFSKENVTCYTVVEKLQDETALVNECVVSIVLRKTKTDTFVRTETDANVVNKVIAYLNELEGVVEKTYLEVKISDQEKQLEKTQKSLSVLEKDSVRVVRQLNDFNIQAKEIIKNLDEKRKELTSQQSKLDELASKRKK